MSLKTLFTTVLDFLFPRSPAEHRLALLTEQDLTGQLCVRTLPDETVVLFKYHTPLIKDAIWHLKYKHSLEKNRIVELFGNMLSEYVTEELSDDAVFGAPPPLLIPIPITNARRRERGYNHTELIAHNLANSLPHSLIYEPDGLRKIRETKPQAQLKRKERLTNVQNTFEADPSCVREKHVIVIDDVVTTGSTFAEARRALGRAGATSVTCIALAG